MKKINFRKFTMFLDIAHEKTQVSDVSRDLADAIYRGANGLLALDLAMRIYKAEGEIELNQEELAFVEKFLNQNSSAMFIDSFKENLHD